MSDFDYDRDYGDEDDFYDDYDDFYIDTTYDEDDEAWDELDDDEDDEDYFGFSFVPNHPRDGGPELEAEAEEELVLV